MAEFTRDEVVEKVKNHLSLEFADLRGLDLRGVDFRKANLSGAELSECRLNGARLASANLQKAKLFEADLTTVDLSGANLSGANLQKAILAGANLSHAVMPGASLRFADLSGATLAHADLAGADLVRAKFREADLREAVLTDADLGSAFLRGALMRGANLLGANIEGAVGLDPALTTGGTGTPQLDLTQRGGARRPGPVTLGYGGGQGGGSANGSSSGSGLSDTPGALKRTRVAKGPRPTKYHAELRRVPSVIFTPNGWIRGVFHVPVMHGFLEHLNLAGEFLKLTDVTLPDLKLDLAFFGLRRSKALIVLPDCDPKVLALPHITADYTVHRVTFLMEGGTVTGSLAIEEDIRLSDFLTNHDHYVLLKNCRFGAYDTGPEEESRFPFLLVNTAGVIGGSDEKLDL